MAKTYHVIQSYQDALKTSADEEREAICRELEQYALGIQEFDERIRTLRIVGLIRSRKAITPTQGDPHGQE